MSKNNYFELILQIILSSKRDFYGSSVVKNIGFLSKSKIYHADLAWMTNYSNYILILDLKEILNLKNFTNLLTEYLR